MPALANHRHERFAQELARGKTATEAYELAGYRNGQKNAHRLGNDEGILGRLAELQAERDQMAAEATQKAAEALAIDQQWVMARLVENAQGAHKAGDYGPSNRAIELLGKELGMFIDRKQIGIDGELRGIPDAQLLALFAGSLEEGDGEAGDSTLPN